MVRLVSGVTEAWADERAALIDRLEGRLDVDPAVLDAMGSVPRHRFVPTAHREQAYRDRPVPIGDGATISAPHIVAQMTDLLAPAGAADILEIGTGCGYHAAVTAAMLDAGGMVHSVEVDPTLAETAMANLRAAGAADRVRIRVADGTDGWPAGAPYDGAYLTCAAPQVPPAVLAQCRVGARIVAPLGTDTQRLVSMTVGADGVRERRDHGAVRFVRMR